MSIHETIARLSMPEPNSGQAEAEMNIVCLTEYRRSRRIVPPLVLLQNEDVCSRFAALVERQNEERRWREAVSVHHGSTQLPADVEEML